MITDNEVKRLVDKIWSVENGDPDAGYAEAQAAAKHQLGRELTQPEIQKVLEKYYEKVDNEEEKKKRR